jgi:hypothetical protein
VTIANNGAKHSLGSDYLTATIPLRAESTCAGTVQWSFTYNYATTGGKGTTRMQDPNTVNDVLRSPRDSTTYSYTTPRGMAGRVDAKLKITFTSGVMMDGGVTFYVDGTIIPNDAIKLRLVQLYSGGGYPQLMTGIAGVETGWLQFGNKGGTVAPFTLFGKTGQWPSESYDGGSHIGVMQVDVRRFNTLTDGYDWEHNTLDGVNFFVSEKLVKARQQEDCLRRVYTTLPALTQQQSEQDALVWYGPPSTVAQTRLDHTCKLAYWIPNTTRTGWMKNPDTTITWYTDLVYTCAQGGRCTK